LAPTSIFPLTIKSLMVLCGLLPGVTPIPIT
jgi:hypothetical protein